MTMSSMKYLLAALVLAAGISAASPPARAQVESREGIALQNQILELKREVEQLRQQGGPSGSPSYLGGGYSTPAPAAGNGDLVAQLLSRVDALEEQVRQLRGRVDETQNEVQQQGATLNKRIDDMAFQMQNPQAGAAPPSTRAQPAMPQPTSPPPPGSLTMTPPPTQPQPPPQPVHRTPEMAMQDGEAALARRDYLAAEQNAREVLNGNRTSPRAYDAQFLLAQALMGQRQFSQAAIAYDDTYNRSRKGSHAQDALLGLSNALIAINEKKAACDSLAKLHAEYPAPRPDLRAPIAASMQRAGCR